MPIESMTNTYVITLSKPLYSLYTVLYPLRCGYPRLLEFLEAGELIRG
jgi:hypothetical protein